MRTFEAPGVGALQVIDRADVDRYHIPGEGFWSTRALMSSLRSVPVFSVSRSGLVRFVKPVRSVLWLSTPSISVSRFWSSYGPNLSR